MPDSDWCEIYAYMAGGGCTLPGKAMVLMPGQDMRVKWTYFLVGNRLNNKGYIQDELESHKNLGEPHLVHSDGKGNNKIFVLTWSDIFDDFSKRHDYLMSKLEIEKEIWLKKHDPVEEVVEDIKDNSATLENAIIPKHVSD